MKKLVFVALCLAFVWGAKAQKVVETIDLYEDYAVCMPIMFDSTDVNGKSFSLFNALKTDRSSREVSQELSCDGDGWFSFAVAKGEMRVVNLGFKIVASDCSEAEFKVITPCDLKADFVNASAEKKSSAGDTLTLKADFDKGVYNVSLSLLVNEDCNRLKVICEGKGFVCLTSSAKEPFSLETMLQGKHLYSVNLSPSGNYYLLVYSETDNKGKTKWTWQLKSTDEDRLLYQGNNYFSISWLPKSDLLYYCGKQDGRNTMWVLNPETLTLEVLAQDFPEGQVKFLNNEQAFLIATKDKLNEQRGEVNRVLSPEDRIGDDWRERRDLWLYRLGNKALQRLTFSSHDVALHDVSADGNKALISLSYDDFTHRPFGYRRFFELDLRTLAVDTLFADAFVSDVRYFDDNLLLVSASREAFDGISAKVGKKQIPNMYHSTLLAWDKASRTAPFLRLHTLPHHRQHIFCHRPQLTLRIATHHIPQRLCKCRLTLCTSHRNRIQKEEARHKRRQRVVSLCILFVLLHRRKLTRRKRLISPLIERILLSRHATQTLEIVRLRDDIRLLRVRIIGDYLLRHALPLHTIARAKSPQIVHVAKVQQVAVVRIATAQLLKSGICQHLVLHLILIDKHHVHQRLPYQTVG